MSFQPETLHICVLSDGSSCVIRWMEEGASCFYQGPTAAEPDVNTTWEGTDCNKERDKFARVGSSPFPELALTKALLFSEVGVRLAAETHVSG